MIGVRQLFIIAMLGLSCTIFGQVVQPELDATFGVTQEEMILLATSNKAYPCTPGDIYLLTYTHAGVQEAKELLVQGDQTINLNVFDLIPTSKRTFGEVKTEIETIISEAYPGSFPSLTIKSVGIFQVFLSGDIIRSRYETAWGMTRLSEVIKSLQGDYSSVRNIEIQSIRGAKAYFDLYETLYGGNEEQNPYLKPGDRIFLEKANRVVEIQGEVQNPGFYQLKEGESLEKLIRYAGWFSSKADPQNINLTRSEGIQQKNLSLNILEDDIGDFFLENQDRIYISSKEIKGGVIYLEIPLAESIGQAPIRQMQNFSQGETAGRALLEFADRLSPYADLSSGYIKRGTERIPVDFHRILRQQDYSQDVKLQPDDILAIPQGRLLVSVTGAVFNPAAFNYAPGEDYRYYIDLSGGFDPERNSFQSLIVRNKEGARKEKKAPIEPGDVIIAKNNDFIYQFNRNMPIISTTLTLIMSAITLSQVIMQ